jgi:TonB-linked SusC/RagA family outer membrane protein
MQFNFKIFCLLLFGAAMCTVTVYAGGFRVNGGHGSFNQSLAPIDYTGKVTDKKNKPLAGVTVKIKSSGLTVQTNTKGLFKIAAVSGEVLVVGFVGYQTVEQRLGKNHNLDLTLQDTSVIVINRKRPVDLIYSSMPAELSVSSTDAVYTDNIIKSTSTSIRNALIGKLSGIYTNQGSGMPGGDGVSLTVRGRDPLVIIDGIPRTLTIFDLEEIESVTILKDAVSTAMLGSRSMNGALSIVTRKGIPGKQNISFTAQTGVQQPLKLLKPLNAYDYASLYNEALTNDGIAKVYTDADLQAYKNHTDPYGHPDVDWRNQIIKPSSLLSRYTLNFNGGNKVTRYFVGLENVSQKGILLTSDENKYNTNNDFNSYVIRSNVDIDLNNKLSMGLHLLGRILTGYQPGGGTAGILNSITTTPNNAYPVFNKNMSLAGTTQFQNNIYGQTIRSGYQLNYKRDAIADFYLKRTLDEVVKGLWIRATLSFNASLSQTTTRSKSFATYQMMLSPTGDTSYSKYGTDGTQGNSTAIDYQSRQSYAEVQLGYDRRFGKHGVTALVLGNKDNSVNGSDLPLTYTGVSGRFTYDYQKKYVAEFSFGYNGSNRYPEGARLLFTPSAGLAWNISEESFMKRYSWINSLKLYGSVGKTGWDNAGYFVYHQYYYDGSGYTIGTSASGNTSMNELVLANPDIDYEKANKMNVGLETSVLNNKLSVKAEYFSMKFYDLLMQRGRNTSLLGQSYPNENIGINRNTGLDLSMDWQETKRKFHYFVNINASILKTKVLFQDEVYKPYSWMKQTGQPVGQLFGYTALGLFQTQDEINKSATTEGYTPHPGDIKYKDLNGDGVINQLDQTPIGSTQPLIYYGAQMGFSYKGFDFSALFQGVQNRSITLTGNTEWEFQNNGYGQAYEHQLRRWTPQTAATAMYPRLTVNTNINNDILSSYWVHSGNYMRLKFIELGYSVPQGLIKKMKLETVRVFCNATNLLTISGYDRVDPEVYGGAYPIQRVINAGINIKF